MVPAQSVTRQAIAAMTTAGQRRAAFALESVQGELSYIVAAAESTQRNRETGHEV